LSGSLPPTVNPDDSVTSTSRIVSAGPTNSISMAPSSRGSRIIGVDNDPESLLNPPSSIETQPFSDNNSILGGNDVSADKNDLTESIVPDNPTSSLPTGSEPFPSDRPSAPSLSDGPSESFRRDESVLDEENVLDISSASTSSLADSPQDASPLPDAIQPPEEVDTIPPITSNPPAGFDFPGRPTPGTQPPRRRSDSTDAVRLIRELRSSLTSLPTDNVESEPEAPEPEPDTDEVETDVDETVDTTRESSDDLQDNSNQIVEAALDLNNTDNPPSIADVEQIIDAAPPPLEVELEPQTLFEQESMNTPDAGSSRLNPMGRRLLQFWPPYSKDDATRRGRPTMVWSTTAGAIATVLFLVWVGTAANNRARVLSPVNVVPSSNQ
ncbi:MAG: hypothetical protein F6K11_28725, partial [Leptolyngbya sp. SIO3F4]|nr:hypothetical protein [Leptolyngbya sp. SIO3F4]